MQRKRIVVLLAVVLAVVAGTGCPSGSGSTGGGVTPTPTPTVTSVSVTCSPTTVTNGATSQCSANVTGTGSYSTAVTWSASAGTINATGLFSAPTVKESTAVVVTATSTQDTTKSAPMTLTVTPPVPTITSVVPNLIYLDGAAVVGSIQINGSGFAGGCVLHLGSRGDMTLLEGTTSSQILVNLSFDDATYRPRFDSWSVSCPSGTSNTAQFGFQGNQNTLAFDSSGKLFQLQQGAFTDDKQQHIWEFLVGPGNTVTPNGFLTEGGSGIAYDDTTKSIVRAGAGSMVVDWTNAGGVHTAYNGKQTMAVAAKSGYACVTQPKDGLVSSFNLAQDTPSMVSTSAGSYPWAITMAQLGSELDAVVYSRGDSTLWRISVPDMSTKGFLFLAGIAQVGAAASATAGGWQLTAFNSGSAVGTGAFLAQPDRQLVIFDIATMKETRRVDLRAILGDGLSPIRIAADETHGAVLVAIADPAAGLSRFISVDAKTGTATNLSATSNLLAVGFGVSSDGTQMYVCSLDKCQVLPISGGSSGQLTANVVRRPRPRSGSDGIMPFVVEKPTDNPAIDEPTPSPIPTISVSVVPPEIRVGQSTTIRWSTTGAKNCVGTGDIQGQQPLNGSATITAPIPGTFTGTLTCKGPGGTVSQSATLTVTLF